MSTVDHPDLPVCRVRNLGVVPYLDARVLQEQMAAEISSGLRPPTLLLLEHPHTFTFGRRGQGNNLLWSERELEKLGGQVFWVDRGGDVTYHGPGQLVGYPLLPLGKLDSKGRRPGNQPPRVGLNVNPDMSFWEGIVRLRLDGLPFHRAS